MKDQEFKEKLSQVAEWKIPKDNQETSKNAKRKRGRKSKEELYQEEHEEVFLDLFDGVNPTIAPLILKLKYNPTICEDCGKQCPTGCHKETKVYEANNKRHWRKRCVTCNLHENPYTKKYDLESSKASIVWNTWLKDVSKRYNKSTNTSDSKSET